MQLYFAVFLEKNQAKYTKVSALQKTPTYYKTTNINACKAFDKKC